MEIATEDEPALHWPNPSGFADLPAMLRIGTLQSGSSVNYTFLSRKALGLPMFAPGIISLAFYKRRPSLVQVILGLVATVVLSALLGYVSPGGPLSQIGSVIVAVVGGVILYVVILAFLLYWYQPRHTKPPTSIPPTRAP